MGLDKIDYIEEAGVVDLNIQQGSTYRHNFIYVDKDAVPWTLSGYSARMQFRVHVNSNEILYEATTEGGGLVIDGAGGRVKLEIPAETTEQFNFRRAVYDIELVTPMGRVSRLCHGRVFVTWEITR